MTTYAKQVSRLTVLSLTALMIGALFATPALAVAVSWTAGAGPGDITWANPLNWSSNPSLPGSADDVLFTSATGDPSSSSTPTNEVAASITVNTLWYGQEPPKYHTTQIDAGVTLKISGSAPPPVWGAPDGMAGNYSLLAGNANPTGTSTISQTVINGGGILDVSSSTGGTTGGDIVVRQTAVSSGSHTSILDLSGLNSFNASVDQLLVGYSSGATASVGDGSTQRPSGTLYLAKYNTITLNNTGTNTSTGLVVGHTSGNANTGTGSVGSFLYLGQNNTINVNNVAVGGRKGNGTILANPAFSGATLTMRGVAGGTNRVAGIFIGDNTVNGTSSTTSVGTINLTGVTADILTTSIILGRTASGAAAGTTTGATGTLTFNAGTIDATGMTVALQAATSGCPAIGTVNVGGGNLIVGASGLTLAQFAGGTGSSTGALNLNGGTATLGANITDGGGASTLSLAGGTLNMQGFNIGSATNKIDTLTLASGTLKNVGEINGGGGGGGVSKTTAGTLVIDGVNNYTGATTVAEGTLLADGSLLSFVTVNNTGTLGGKGSVGGVTVNSGGTLNPGDSPGQLTINGNATLGGTMVAEINGSVAGTGYDQIVVNGPASNVSLSGTLNAVKDALFSPDPINDKFWIVVNNSLNALGGAFTNFADGAEVFNDSGNSWTIHYGADSVSGSIAGGNDVLIAVVPEPATLMMLLIAAGLCLMFRRYRNK